MYPLVYHVAFTLVLRPERGLREMAERTERSRLYPAEAYTLETELRSLGAAPRP
jgi:hypothetical protein